MKESVIIIDGLDESVGTEAQCEIVEIIATSVRNKTTPFRWAFFSRPEPHIIATFSSNRISSLSFSTELPVSREVDHEILCYLTDEFKKIQERHRLPPLWPSELDIETVVNLVAGLFIYAATIIRFVGEHNSLGPDDQLRAVLTLAASTKGKTKAGHPLAELDLFYTLIMHRIPSKILPAIQKVLLLRSADDTPVLVFLYANVLGFSELQIQSALGSLQSVLHLDSGPDPVVRFYHAFFLDFIQDPERSGEFCAFSSYLDDTRRELLERLNTVHSQSPGMYKSNDF